MAVNGIEIEVGQKWRCRDGLVRVVAGYDDETDTEYVWDLDDGDSVTDTGSVRGLDTDMPEDADLIELVEHADGFKPWAGGEQPEETRGKLVMYRLRSGLHGTKEYADVLDWRNDDISCDIVAYQVIGEAAKPAPEPEPLHVELIEPPQDALDVQVGGDHYKSLAIQPVEYIHANKIGYFEGNVIKYVSRWRAKNGIADLEKAKHYIDLLIELEGGAK